MVRLNQHLDGKYEVLARLADEDPRFRRYPPLPVVACAGYREAESTPEPSV